MKVFIQILIYVVICQVSSYAQILQGSVYDSETKTALAGVSVYSILNQKGAYTDSTGSFQLNVNILPDTLIISMQAYQVDTMILNSTENIEVFLKAGIEMEAVEITGRNEATQLSLVDNWNTQILTQGELRKAACCNLAESFETTPAVDVSFTDAVTATRQIQLLGLSGKYTQITQDNLPFIRGLSTVYGLSWLPGTWIDAIHVSKGTGSVTNGYESIAGQINVNLREPGTSEQLYANLYANQNGRLEANLNLLQKISPNWRALWMLHSNHRPFENDRNEDGFLDMPTGETYTALTRWHYLGNNGITTIIGLKGIYEDRRAGQPGFEKDQQLSANLPYGVHRETKRVEPWAKIGYVFPSVDYRSVGIQLSGIWHEQNGIFGTRRYQADQSSFNANLLYQQHWAEEKHRLKTGFSFLYDKSREQFSDFNMLTGSYGFQEIVPGAFAEYSYQETEKFGLVLGLRWDYHNLFGSFFTPRMHLRWNPSTNTAIKFAVGRGQRTSRPLSENPGVLVSSREFMVDGNSNIPGYGLEPDIAWNAGINFLQKFRWDYREGSFSLDYYQTFFSQQTLLDRDFSTQMVRFYQRNNASTGHSIQAEFNYEIIRRTDLRLAYRWLRIEEDYINGTLSKPLIPEHRAFINLAHQTRKNINGSQWIFDITIQWTGSQRLPQTAENPSQFQLASRSDDFLLINSQVTRVVNKQFEIYIGGENIGNYRQPNAILSAENPYGAYFDASMIWGPIIGRNIYLGLRYYIF